MNRKLMVVALLSCFGITVQTYAQPKIPPPGSVEEAEMTAKLLQQAKEKIKKRNSLKKSTITYQSFPSFKC